ncbi:MAG: hypothetical protein ACXVAY_01610 [Mucilaginibacter sp.]
MKKSPVISLLRYSAIAGNMVFVLWIAFNAMDEGLKGTLVEKASAIALTGLLAANSFLLIYRGYN